MYNSKNCIILSTFLTLLTITSVGSTYLDVSSDGPSWIQCYKCSSLHDPRCGDPFDPFTIGMVNCSLREPLEHLPPGIKPKMCRKNVQKIYGKLRVIRGCGYIEDDYKDKKCLYRTGTFNVQSTYCSCSGQLCNTAGRIHHPYRAVSLHLVLIISFISL